MRKFLVKSLVKKLECVLISDLTPLCRPAVSLFVQFYGCITIFIIFHECYVWYTVVKLFLLSGCCKIYSSISYYTRTCSVKKSSLFLQTYSIRIKLLYCIMIIGIVIPNKEWNWRKTGCVMDDNLAILWKKYFHAAIQK